MCKCTPNLITPFRGKGDCVWPEQIKDAEVTLIELETHFDNAASALKAAWILCKHNGLEPIAKELADTVLDVEEALRQVRLHKL